MPSITMVAHAQEASRRDGELVGLTSRLALGRCVQDPVRVNSGSDTNLKHNTWDPIEMELSKQNFCPGSSHTPLRRPEREYAATCMCRALLTLPAELHPKCPSTISHTTETPPPKQSHEPMENTRKASVIGCGVLDCHQTPLQ